MIFEFFSVIILENCWQGVYRIKEKVLSNTEIVISNTICNNCNIGVSRKCYEYQIKL